MSEFAKDLLDWGDVAAKDFDDVFDVVVREVDQSYRFGSTITGSLGIPVDTSAALNSVIPERISKHEWQIAGTGQGLNEKTGKYEEVGYLRHINDNVRGVTFHTNGPHFYDDTIAGYDKIVDAAVREVAK